MPQAREEEQTDSAGSEGTTSSGRFGMPRLALRRAHWHWQGSGSPGAAAAPGPASAAAPAVMTVTVTCGGPGGAGVYGTSLSLTSGPSRAQ